MTPIKKQAVRSGEIAGTVATNVMVAQAVMERVYIFADAHNWNLSGIEKTILFSGMCAITQVLWYNGRKLLKKYVGGMGD